MFVRKQLDYAIARLFKGKAFIVFGPRQVGKTTFVEQLLNKVNKKTLYLNGDDADVRANLLSPNAAQLERLLEGYEILFIDEAQRINEVGLFIKIIVDRFKHVQVIATGSSAFELSGKINEPLTGRKYEMMLLPFSYAELVDNTDFLTEERLLEQRLRYGSYPEVINDEKNAEEHLKLLADSYLYKDLFTLEDVKKPMLFEKIVKALALQVGSEVNFSELAQLVKADQKTVERYIDLLEKAFVVFSLPAFSGNVRNEIKKGRKIYFYDTGIINAITRNFNPMANRNDVGALFENYMISERIKYLYQNQKDVKYFFWRTTQQQEIDYIEQQADQILAVEFKWNENKKVKIPTTFKQAYQNIKSIFVSKADRGMFLT
ncbi:ATP-binding protein [Pedobacter chitinilyticus]|uniref:ATP-binding protein n=1 Tax=Pedobacter chitinilyticus TaxID=2233776 RepID=A0A443YPN2_9SPHI|nr:ATP-binding protein [Pedobacter chitinilyticus]RWU05708.1 ATP-binding protein [Pedobacter chitinilyticus]